MPFLLLHKRGVHIDHQLQLQAVIEGNYVKSLTPCLIIQNLYIDLLIFFAGIDTVNLSVRESEFIGGGRKIPGLKLSGQRPDRPCKKPLHTDDHIFIPCRTI